MFFVQLINMPDSCFNSFPVGDTVVGFSFFWKGVKFACRDTEGVHLPLVETGHMAHVMAITPYSDENDSQFQSVYTSKTERLLSLAQAPHGPGRG